MDLARQMEEWKIFWERVPDPFEVERQLRKLRWLEGFAFHSKGNAVTPEMFRALTKQIETGEAKLRELRGEEPGQKGDLETPVSELEFVSNSRAAYLGTERKGEADEQSSTTSRTSRHHSVGRFEQAHDQNGYQAESCRRL